MVGLIIDQVHLGYILSIYTWYGLHCLMLMIFEIFFFIIPYWSIIVDLNNWVRPMFISFSVFWISSWRLGSCHLVCIWRILVGSPLCCFLISQLCASCPVCSSSLSGVRLVRWSLYQDTNCAEVESRVVWHVALKPNMFLQLIF